ncbi:MAG: hypothetical protein WC505_06895 [Patescibacteria group bacterium]
MDTDLQKEYGVLYTKVLDILYTADLAQTHSPDPNEYWPEVGEIIPRLHLCGSPEEVHSLVYRVFCQLFSDKIAGDFDRYRAPAERIFEAYILYQPV